MHTACLHIVRGERREVLCPGPRWGEGGVVTWSQGGGRCCVLVWGGREVLWPGPGGGGRREMLWPGPRGREVLWPGLGGGGGICCDLVPGGEGRCCDLVPGGWGREVLWPLVLPTSHPLNRMSDTRLWKHNLRSLRYTGGNYGKVIWMDAHKVRGYRTKEGAGGGGGRGS